MKRAHLLLIGAVSLGALLLRFWLPNTPPSITPPAGWRTLSKGDFQAAAGAAADLVGGRLPEAWLNNRDVVRCFAEVQASPKPDLARVLVLAIHPGRLSLTERPFEELASEVRKAWSSFEAPFRGTVVEVEVVQLGGKAALRAVVDWEFEGKQLRGTQYTLPAGARTVTVTGVTPAADFPSHQRLFEQAARTVGLPWEAPQWLLLLLTGLGFGGLAFVWLSWRQAGASGGSKTGTVDTSV